MSVKFSPIWETMFKNAGLAVPAVPVNAWPWPTRESRGAEELKKYLERVKAEKRGAL